MPAEENKSREEIQRRNNKRVLIWLSIVALLMFGFAYAMVPLYNVFCEITGLNGKTAGQVSAYQSTVDKSRWVTVEFVANNNDHLPWQFYPLTKKVRLHPGEKSRVAYFAKNRSGKTMVVQAIPSVTPGIAAQYLIKTECFCFNRQTLKSGESMKMPLIFYVDKDLPRKIKTLTLSYTLFDTTDM